MFVFFSDYTPTHFVYCLDMFKIVTWFHQTRHWNGISICWNFFPKNFSVKGSHVTNPACETEHA